jgi:hypothetical protein
MFPIALSSPFAPAPTFGPDSQGRVKTSSAAPSTVTAERALEARTLLGPQFQHNVMATRMARTSNLMADAPRFRNQLDILA